MRFFLNLYNQNSIFVCLFVCCPDCIEVTGTGNFSLNRVKDNSKWHFM